METPKIFNCSVAIINGIKGDGYVTKWKCDLSALLQ